MLGTVLAYAFFISAQQKLYLAFFEKGLTWSSIRCRLWSVQRNGTGGEKEMVSTVWGQDGDEVIITSLDFGYRENEFLVEVLEEGAYRTIYSSTDYDRVLAKALELKGEEA